ncbi:Proline-rich extensin-like protein EPR1, partial [Ophiophagus hannah]
MPCTTPNKSTEEITAMHFVSIQPLDEISLGSHFHPNHHDPGIFLEDPNVMECIHFNDAHPHGEFYRRIHIVEMIELPFSPDAKESDCPLHKHVHPGSEHSQEDPEKATSPSSSEPKSKEKLETANDGGGENIASNGDANNLSPSKDPEDAVGLMYTCKLEYQWSPMLKYCTMEELGYKPLHLLSSPSSQEMYTTENGDGEDSYSNYMRSVSCEPPSYSVRWSAEMEYCDTPPPPVRSYCPPRPIYCPPAPKGCPTKQKYCPPVQRYCPPVQKYRPPVKYCCPPGRKSQPPAQWCSPPVQKCHPPVQSYCPPVQKYCRPVQRYCPPQQKYHPPAQPCYPPQQKYCPPAQSYRPPAQPCYPPQQKYCPPAQSYRPPAQLCYPPQQKYCPPAQSYCPPAQPCYPPQQKYCPPAQSYCPPAEPCYPPQQKYCPPAQSYCPPAQPCYPPQQKYCPPAQPCCSPQPKICQIKEVCKAPPHLLKK